MLKEFLLPAAVLTVLASLIFPLPAAAIDIMLAGNIVLALILFGSSLYIAEPLKISSLPSILLLATLYRLALNVSTTRLILSGGDVGGVISAFGSVVINDNLVVGAIVFLIITLVQFIVIAKGSERVAEVSARFTLDALPGKQMSIDADVRAGLIDFQEARDKRQSLQIESRFYGALDGAMKFVKGDAIAGIIITAVNVIGGLILGIFIYDLDIGAAFSRYTILTVGDGLLSQIPALLNSMAAGMIVTRVARGDSEPLASEVLNQLVQIRKVKILVAIVAMLLALCPGMPFIPFCVVAVALGVSGIKGEEGNVSGSGSDTERNFKPDLSSKLQIHVGSELRAKMLEEGQFSRLIENCRKKVYEKTGLLISVPEFKKDETGDREVEIYLRSFLLKKFSLNPEEGGVLNAVLEEVRKIAFRNAAEFLDDNMTRRLLDGIEPQAPEMIANLIPDVLKLTRFTEILKNLLEERVSIRNLDLIMQSVAESFPVTGDVRKTTAEVRIALKRVLSSPWAGDGKIKVITLDPEIDLAFSAAEVQGGFLKTEHIETLIRAFRGGDAEFPLICSENSRRLIYETLRIHGVQARVFAFDELVDSVSIEVVWNVEMKSVSDIRSDVGLESENDNLIAA